MLGVGRVAGYSTRLTSLVGLAARPTSITLVRCLQEVAIDAADVFW